jgi:hypothetical protein
MPFVSIDRAEWPADLTAQSRFGRFLEGLSLSAIFVEYRKSAIY